MTEGSRTTPGAYRLGVSDTLEDSAWDSFLERTPGGHHTQTSLWAQVKASLGWQPLRIVATRSDEIVAGVQLLFRRIPVIGAVGYVSKGPVFAYEDPVLTSLVLDELERTVRASRIQHLTIQPPDGGNPEGWDIVERRFSQSTTAISPPATVILDVTQDSDTLLAAMSRRTRYNVRLGIRKGVIVREGDESDLGSYYRILETTARRQGFSPFPERYFAEMWRVLEPRGHLNLFIAELDGEAVSAQIVVPFGAMVVNKMSVWSGRQGESRPNEALQWSAIEWSRDAGYAHYDMEGINPEAARALLGGGVLPESLHQSVTSFKLGFGGQVVVFPDACDYIHNPAARWMYTGVYPRIRDRRSVKRLIKGLRTRSAGSGGGTSKVGDRGKE